MKLYSSEKTHTTLAPSQWFIYAMALFFVTIFMPAAADSDNTSSQTQTTSTATPLLSEEWVVWLAIIGSIGSATGIPSLILAAIQTAQGCSAKKQIGDGDIITVRAAKLLDFENNSALLRWGAFAVIVNLLSTAIKDRLGLNQYPHIPAKDASAIADWLLENKKIRLTNELTSKGCCTVIFTDTKGRPWLHLLSTLPPRKQIIENAFARALADLPGTLNNGHIIPLAPDYFIESMLTTLPFLQPTNKWLMVFLQRLHRRIQEERGLEFERQILTLSESRHVVRHLAANDRLITLFNQCHYGFCAPIKSTKRKLKIIKRVPESVVAAITTEIIKQALPAQAADTDIEAGPDTPRRNVDESKSTMANESHNNDEEKTAPQIRTTPPRARLRHRPSLRAAESSSPGSSPDSNHESWSPYNENSR